MELRQARYFLATCETLNFTRAAALCGVSTPSLSRAITALEDELGGELFRRERRLTHLTSLAEIVRERLRVAVEAVDDAKRAAASYRRAEKAPLKIGVQRDLPPDRFAPFFTELAGGRRAIDLKLIVDEEANLVERLTAGELDLALMNQSAGHDRIRRAPLFEDRYAAAVRSDHPLAAGDAAPLSSLADASSICGPGPGFAADLARAGADPSDPVVGRIETVDDEDWRLSLAAAGLAVAIVSERAEPPAGVTLKPLSAPEVVRRIGLSTVSGRRHAPPVALALKTARAMPWGRGAARSHGPRVAS